MLRPIPRRILTTTVTLYICKGVDVWQSPEYKTQEIKNTCLQATNETRKTQTNTEVVLRSILFVDARLSSPAGLDFDALKNESEGYGHPLTLSDGKNTYTVLTIDSVIDDTGNLHHTELGLV